MADSNVTDTDNEDMLNTNAVISDCGKINVGSVNSHESLDDFYTLDDYRDFDDIDDFCEDDEKELCPESFHDALMQFLHQLVAIEFECADCCKKATGILRCVGKDYVMLINPPGKRVIIQMFSHCEIGPLVECACRVVIKIDKLISVEQIANEGCP